LGGRLGGGAYVIERVRDSGGKSALRPLTRLVWRHRRPGKPSALVAALESEPLDGPIGIGHTP